VKLRPPVPLLVVAAALVTVVLVASAASPSRERLTAEIERWVAYVRDNPSQDPVWLQVKESSGPAIERARQALRDDRLLVALNRLASARTYLAGSAWVAALPARDSAAFEAEWTRLGRELGAAPTARALEGVRPAAVRAIGEVALPQARTYHDASLEYGRNTMADYGLLYLGAAEAQRTFVAFVRKLEWESPLPPPPIRALDAELAALRAEMLAVYRPPVSIDRHAEFIGAHSTLNEAAELNAAGLHHGALLRYLQASLRFAPLRPAPPPIARAALDARLRELTQQLDRARIDHSLGYLFLESAAAELALVEADSTPPGSAAIATDVLPRYLAALAPAPPLVAKAKPAEVTVTLVRWPYT